MDIRKFVQNVKYYCDANGIKPTAACRESGAGERLLENVKRGSEPSVGKVQLLAQYLGVTVSDLLGEEPAPQMHDSAVKIRLDDVQRLTIAEVEMVLAYRHATEDDRLIVDAALRKYKKGTTSATG